MNDSFIMKKRVDKSTLYQGVSIPVMFQELFYEKIGHRLSRGETMIDGLTYDVKLTNQPFDERKYPGRSDILQIRYDGNTALKEVLRSKFKNTWESVQEYHAENQSFKGFEIEEGKEEYADRLLHQVYRYLPREPRDGPSRRMVRQQRRHLCLHHRNP